MSEGTESPAPAAAPGWYPDPQRPELQWYWDGTAWGESRRAPLPPPPMRCLFCGGGDFRRASYMLNTQGLTMLGWDGFNKTAECRICMTCGFIHWFAPLEPAG